MVGHVLSDHVDRYHYRVLLKEVIMLAWPLAVLSLLGIMSVFISVFIMAHFGHDVLAASALISATQITLIVAAFSLFIALSAIVGQLYGAKKYAQIGSALRQGWAVSILLSVPTMLLLYFIQPILLFVGQESVLTQIVERYFHAYLWGVIPLLLSMASGQFLVAVKKQIWVMWLNMANLLILAFVSMVLGFGCWGFPALGVAGVGYAVAVQYSFSLCCYCGLFYFSQSLSVYEVLKWGPFFGEYMAKIWQIGWPIMLQMTGEILSLQTIVILIGLLDQQDLAAFQVANQFLMIAIVPVIGIGQAATVMVSHKMGAKDYVGAKRVGYMNMILGLGLTLVIASLFIGWAEPMVWLYLHETHNLALERETLAIILLTVAAFTQIFDGQRNIIISALRGMYDTRFPMWVGLLATWLLAIPLGALLAFWFQYGVIGMSVGWMLGVMVGAVIMLLRWRYECALVGRLAN